MTTIPPFEFSGTPRIIFGAGAFAKLTDLIKQYGATAAVITGARSFIRSAAWQTLQKKCAAEQLTINHYSIDTEPTVERVDALADQCRITACNVIVAIGGGSVLDCGKAISAMVPHTESVKVFLETVGTKNHPGTKIPFIAIPTTAGTGSEAAKNAVIKCSAPDFIKASLRHENFMPDRVLIDPELHITCPQAVTAACGMDALTQLIESYVSTGATPLSDELALSGICRIKDNLLAAYADGTDLDARSAVAYGALLSGICLTNAGLGVVHGVAGVMGGLAAIPHGVICGTLLAPATQATIQILRRIHPDHPALVKYARIARALSSTDIAADTIDEQCDKLIDLLYLYQDKLAMPLLHQFDITGSTIEIVAQKTSSKNNPVKLDPVAIKAILQERL